MSSSAAVAQGTLPEDGAEVEWIAGLRAGCPDAFARLQCAYLDAVHAYVARRLPDRHAAEDVTCAVFEAAVDAARRYRGQGGLYAWLLGIARRKVVDWRRREGRRLDHSADVTVPEPVDPMGPAQFVEQGELHRAMRAAIAELPAAEREALLLQVAEGLSLQQIAAVMHRSPNAVKCLHRRARERLRAKLAPLLDEPEGGER